MSQSDSHRCRASRSSWRAFESCCLVMGLGRILKVGVQNLKQGVQVQWTTITDVSVGRVK